MSIDNNIDFKDHIVQYPNRFKQTTVAPGVVELVPTWITNSDEIIEAGTPVDSELFKKLKQNVTIYQQTFTTTENQTVINLNRNFLVGQNRVSLSIGGVRQYEGQDYTETDSHTLTMTTTQKGGLKAEVIMFTASQAIAEDFFEQTVAAIAATQAANNAATQALAAKETAYTVQLTPVANFAAIATTYPSAVNGSEVQTLDDGKIYRKENGSWIYRKELTPGPYATLNTRIDEKADKTDLGIKTNLKTSDKTNIVNSINEHDSKIRQRDFLRFGIIDLPSDFPKQLPFQLFRDRDGKVKHNINLKPFDPQFRFYVDGKVGSDTNNGLTTATPFKNVSKALAAANGRAESTIGIVFLRKLEVFNIYEGQTTPTFTISKNIVLESIHPEGTFVGTWNNNLTWTLDGGVYKTSRTAAQEVVDYTFKDFRGLPRLLKKVMSLAECQAQRGTWYTDGALVYVNRLDGSAPGEDVTVVIPVNCSYDFTISGYKLMLNNVHFWLRSSSGLNPSLKVTGNNASQFVAYKSSFALARGNGLSTVAVGEVYTLECDAFLNGYDGLNYHGFTPISATPYEFVFEYNCYSHDNGALDGSSGNATTAHEGMTVLRVGTIGHDCYGPLVADVNGCYSVNIDVFMNDSLGSIAITRSAFYFDENQKAKEGYAYLINCGGGGDPATYTVSSDGRVPVFIKNLTGTKINTNTPITYLD